MANWSVKQVSRWLKDNGFRRQVKIFKDENIDGHALMAMTDEDISQLVVEIDPNGSIQETTIGAKSRFRIKLMELKLQNEQENAKKTNETSDHSLTVVRANVNAPVHSNEEQPDNIVSDNVRQEALFFIDDIIQAKFFKNRALQSHLINFIKQEIKSIEIVIEQMHQNDNNSSVYYVIKVTGTKQENRLVERFLQHLKEVIKSKRYLQNTITKLLLQSKPNCIVQNIFDLESHIFTVCQLTGKCNQTLDIYYFDDDEFNSPYHTTEIDVIFQNNILHKSILTSSNDKFFTIELIDNRTQKTLSNYRICPTTQYNTEFDEIINQCSQDNSIVSVTCSKYCLKNKIEIFGYEKLVTEILRKFKSLFERHQLKRFKFSRITPNELDGLKNLCLTELQNIEKQFRNYGVQFLIPERSFYASENLKDEVETCVMNLLSKIHTHRFESQEFYYNIIDKSFLPMKNLARKNHCYCDFESITELKQCRIPRADENTSDPFCSSPSISSRVKLDNGSINIVTGDISQQKVDIIIISSLSSGVKQNIIERAGEIVQKQSRKDLGSNSLPFITETTGGRLACKKILFVNWSLPTGMVDDDYLSESISEFISKTIRYVIKNSKSVQSIAFAVPDSCKQEQILAEEMIEATVNQIKLIKSIPLNVSFVLLPDQKTLQKQFFMSLQSVPTTENSFGTLSYPVSTMKIMLMSTSTDYFTDCEKSIHMYLNRSMFTLKIDGFQHWNQNMINSFYEYSINRYVLPKLDEEQQLILCGFINNVYEVKQKYHLTNAFVQGIIFLPHQPSTSTTPNRYNIMLSHSVKDWSVAESLATRLVHDGFNIWMKSIDGTASFQQISRKMNKSDCIILCISNNYFEDELCKKEATYADETGKIIIAVKIQNYDPINWLQKLLTQNGTYFQLFGSEHNFNMEYDKLLLKIMQYTRPNSIFSSVPFIVSNQHKIVKSYLNNKELHFLLTIEQRKSQYEKNVKKSMMLEKGRITEDDKENLILQVQDIIMEKESQCEEYISYGRQNYLHTNSTEDQQKKDNLICSVRFVIGIFSYKQWSEKIEYSKTILNIAPFAATGNINDTAFPVLNIVLDNLHLLNNLTQNCSSLTSKDYRVGSRYLSSKPCRYTNTFLTKRKEKLKGFSLPVKPIFSSTNTNKELKVAKKHDERRKVVIPYMHRVRRILSDSEKLEYRLQFAKQMRKNQSELDKLCDDIEHGLKRRSAQPIYVYPAAIFCPSPFSKMKIEPIKTILERHTITLPLKFPWNDVFDTEPIVVKWQKPSIFFSFESAILETN
ncbi:hypothetical protein I4U23_011937 [Adineta vaga]|nr:hypothetical protein I4U23_011937 [Adineta vaga]